MNHREPVHVAAPPAAYRPRRRFVARAIAGLLALVLVLYLGISAVAANQLSRPERARGGQTPAALGLTYHEVRFPARHDSVRIAAWYIPREGSRRAVIMVHGLDSSRATEYNGEWVEVAEALWHADLSVLMIDLRGHGSSGDGRITFGLRERRDVSGGVDWLRHRGYPPGRIGLLGISLGGAAAVGAAAESPEVGAVATDAVFAEAEPVIRRAWPQESGLPLVFWPSARLMSQLLLGYDPGASRPVEDVALLAPRPLLLIHGRADERVPIEHAHQLQRVHGTARVWIVPGAEHGEAFLVRPAAYRARVSDFFTHALDGSPAPR